MRAYPSRQEGESALVEVDQLVCRALASGMKERGGEQQHGKLGGDGEEEASLSACSVVSAQSVSLIPLTPCSATEPEVSTSPHSSFSPVLRWLTIWSTPSYDVTWNGSWSSRTSRWGRPTGLSTSGLDRRCRRRHSCRSTAPRR